MLCSTKLKEEYYTLSFHEYRSPALSTGTDVKAGGGLRLEYSVGDPERRRLKLKHAWNWFVLLPTTAGRSQAVQI